MEDNRVLFFFFFSILETADLTLAPAVRFLSSWSCILDLAEYSRMRMLSTNFSCPRQR